MAVLINGEWRSRQSMNRRNEGYENLKFIRAQDAGDQRMLGTMFGRTGSAAGGALSRDAISKLEPSLGDEEESRLVRKYSRSLREIEGGGSQSPILEHRTHVRINPLFEILGFSGRLAFRGTWKGASSGNIKKMWAVPSDRCESTCRVREKFSPSVNDLDGGIHSSESASTGGRALRAGACLEFVGLPLELLRELHELTPRRVIPR
jgi:hypothetical protein